MTLRSGGGGICVISDDQHASECSLQAAQPDKAGMHLRQAQNRHLPACSQHQSSGLWRNRWICFCGRPPAWTASAGCMRAGCPGTDCTWPALRHCRVSLEFWSYEIFERAASKLDRGWAGKFCLAVETLAQPASLVSQSSCFIDCSLSHASTFSCPLPGCSC